MSWEHDPLWAKACLFFERAFNESREEPTFGLWCSLGLELLARSALASISPALLAEPNRDHKNLLHALNRGSEGFPKSISTSQVFGLCHKLFADFTKEDHQVSLALANRRNEELHTGSAAFDQYPSSQWLAGFYQACVSLSASIDKDLESLFGEDEARIANEMLKDNRNEVRQHVESSIASHRKVFMNKSPEDRKNAAQEAQKQGAELSLQRHHRVECPACKCVATVQGRVFGKEHVINEETEIIVRQAVTPTSFECPACGLKLDGYAQLDVAGLGGNYQRTTKYSPDEYYGLIDPDNLDEYIQEYLGDIGPEYDNE